MKEPNTIKGLTCQIYRSSLGECSNGGISAKVQAVTLIGLGPRTEIFEPTAERPAVRLVERHFRGELYLHAEPILQPRGQVGPMAGGTFIYSNDSRFPSPYPIALHDRFETAETYEVLSR